MISGFAYRNIPFCDPPSMGRSFRVGSSLTEEGRTLTAWLAAVYGRWVIEGVLKDTIEGEKKEKTEGREN